MKSALGAQKSLRQSETESQHKGNAREQLPPPAQGTGLRAEKKGVTSKLILQGKCSLGNKPTEKSAKVWAKPPATCRAKVPRITTYAKRLGNLLLFPSGRHPGIFLTDYCNDT